MSRTATASPGTVSVINTANNQVTAIIPVGSSPAGVSVSSDGGKIYVANSASNNVSVINTATNTVIATIPVGSHPVAPGLFIQRQQNL
jgi:YVTN family beta-propeller protein